MERVLIGELKEHIGKTITIAGWVDVRRDQGKLVFFDMRDMSSSVQTVVPPKSEAMEIAKTVRQGDVVSMVGEVKQRPEQNVHPDRENGDIELSVSEITVLNESEPMPFDPSEDTSGIGEEARLAYRYLDLRSPRMQRNLRIRSEFVQRCRQFLFEQKFTEIETPILTESTPEGSRDFVVPSRLQPGKFYALPQSPQQYKQLLMIAGMERYFQVARAVRDEDLRADRGFEHSQLDIELSFVDEESVMNLVEKMVTQTVEGMGYTVKEKSFPRFTYAEAMEQFGADKFDLRTPEEKEQGVLAYAWVHRFPFFEKTDDGSWTFTHNPFSMPIPEHVEKLRQKEDVENIVAAQYDLVCNGYEAGGGSIRAHDPELLRATYDIMGYSPTETEEKIGHMLKALQYGAPPHGGIALGIERNIMNLTGEEYLREVQAFPMTGGGQTAVMEAPKPLTEEQLAELGIRIDLKKGKHDD